jgi:hypothetical protein
MENLSSFEDWNWKVKDEIKKEISQAVDEMYVETCYFGVELVPTLRRFLLAKLDTCDFPEVSDQKWSEGGGEDRQKRRAHLLLLLRVPGARRCLLVDTACAACDRNKSWGARCTAPPELVGRAAGVIKASLLARPGCLISLSRRLLPASAEARVGEDGPAYQGIAFRILASVVNCYFH